MRWRSVTASCSPDGPGTMVASPDGPGRIERAVRAVIIPPSAPARVVELSGHGPAAAALIGARHLVAYDLDGFTLWAASDFACRADRNLAASWLATVSAAAPVSVGGPVLLTSPGAEDDVDLDAVRSYGVAVQEAR